MRKQILLLLCVTLPGCVTVATGADLLPERGASSFVPAKRWEEAFVTGNGRMGAMPFGNPENETLIANHCRLFLPLGSREIPSDLAAELPEYRRLIREKGYNEAKNFLNAKAAAQGDQGLVPTDPLHPGFFVHVRQEAQGEIRNYLRTEDFGTGEVVVRWEEDRGEFRRRLFVSRVDNLIVFSLTGPAEVGLDCELEFPDPSPPNRKITDGGRMSART